MFKPNTAEVINSFGLKKWHGTILLHYGLKTSFKIYGYWFGLVICVQWRINSYITLLDYSLLK